MVAERDRPRRQHDHPQASETPPSISQIANEQLRHRSIVMPKATAAQHGTSGCRGVFCDESGPMVSMTKNLPGGVPQRRPLQFHLQVSGRCHLGRGRHTPGKTR